SRCLVLYHNRHSRGWGYTVWHDHRTRPASRSRGPRYRAHHHRVALAELATRLLVDCYLKGTERCTAYRRCRKGRPSTSNLSRDLAFFRGCNSCRHCNKHAQLAHRVGSPLLLLGSHSLRNPVYGGLAVGPFTRVEHPDDRHPDECCRAIHKMTVQSYGQIIVSDQREM